MTDVSVAHRETSAALLATALDLARPPTPETRG